MAKPNLSADRLRELFTYNQETGVFTRRSRTSNRVKEGDVAGSLRPNGYIAFRVDSSLQYAHRMAVLYMTGEMPLVCVDHINHDKTDNRWCNLRSVSVSVNQQNRRAAQSNSISGLLGVHWYAPRGTWAARIGIGGKDKVLGYFKDPNDAHKAYIEAKRALHAGNTL